MFQRDAKEVLDDLHARHVKVIVHIVPWQRDRLPSLQGTIPAKPGPLKDLYDRCVAGGVPKEMAKLTLARKLAAVALRLWKKGELWNPEKLTMQAP